MKVTNNVDSASSAGSPAFTSKAEEARNSSVDLEARGGRARGKKRAAPVVVRRSQRVNERGIKRKRGAQQEDGGEQASSSTERKRLRRTSVKSKSNKVTSSPESTSSSAAARAGAQPIGLLPSPFPQRFVSWAQNSSALDLEDDSTLRLLGTVCSSAPRLEEETGPEEILYAIRALREEREAIEALLRAAAEETRKVA